MIPESIQQTLLQFVVQSKQPELIATYLRYVEQILHLKPVVVVKEKLVFRSEEDAIKILEAQGKLWRETEIKIGYTQAAVNEHTTKIYICPFTGKVFGNNTHPNPQDAIYDWVASCPENTERVCGVKAKRFFISEDPQMIAEYAKKMVTKAPVTKIVFSSGINGKIFHSKESVIDDFISHYLQPVSLTEVQGHAKFQFEPSFLHTIESYLQEDKIAAFVEDLAELEPFLPYVERWLGDVEQDT